MSESEQLRVGYENIVRNNPSNTEAVTYLALWHMHRNSYSQARKYFGHLATLKEDCDVFICLSVCCAMTNEFDESLAALRRASNLRDRTEDGVRLQFCHALIVEKRGDFQLALEGYNNCLTEIARVMDSSSSSVLSSSQMEEESVEFRRRMDSLKGEVLLRLALLRKEMGHIELAMTQCSAICSDSNTSYAEHIRANALCLKGLLHEMRGEFPASEVVYRSALQILPGHGPALERLGRVYLRYRETIPAAVQCFFKSVETNPSSHVAWYLLGRCYMATGQYPDAFEAYNRAINLNPNDPQVWCSLGVLYYAFGQYKESLGMLARALKLEPAMADAWYNVGALYDMVDQPQDAQLAYMKARENGLADRIARAGMGLNPLAMQPPQSRPPPTEPSSSHISSSSSHLTSGTTTATTEATS